MPGKRRFTGKHQKAWEQAGEYKMKLINSEEGNDCLWGLGLRFFKFDFHFGEKWEIVPFFDTDLNQIQRDNFDRKFCLTGRVARVIEFHQDDSVEVQLFKSFKTIPEDGRTIIFDSDEASRIDVIGWHSWEIPQRDQWKLIDEVGVSEAMRILAIGG